MTNSLSLIFAARRAALSFRYDTGSSSHAAWYTSEYFAVIFALVLALSFANVSCIHAPSSG
ncbi:hypothetical protein L7750_13910 [Xenorhabdus bovienii]|uniref:hypothetical protein n=1 Tax=Xenorhabdus bovienii TaxID=40576 RepID=UPI001EDCECF1|nr:hypothetical protein [Xenorhabdus bovienii]MCG3471455.1 hypothetical protein [Xenorhabdus bovienii]